MVLLMGGSLFFPCYINRSPDLDNNLVTFTQYGYESIGVLMIVLIHLVGIAPIFNLIKLYESKRESNARLAKRISFLALGLCFFMIYTFYNNTRIGTVYSAPGIGMWLISSLSLTLVIISARLENLMASEK
tara:strand:+ start:45451 stop:45843 length:393 start_codon:yes stop_codon:yes gene_type:complete